MQAPFHSFAMIALQSAGSPARAASAFKFKRCYINVMV